MALILSVCPRALIYGEQQWEFNTSASPYLHHVRHFKIGLEEQASDTDNGDSDPLVFATVFNDIRKKCAVIASRVNPIFSDLQTLQLCFGVYGAIPGAHIVELLLPLLASTLQVVELSLNQRKYTLSMRQVFPELARRLARLEVLSLANSSSQGIYGVPYFQNLKRLTLKELRGEDAPIIESLSNLEQLVISFQTRHLPHPQHRMQEDALARLRHIHLTAERVEALENLLLMLPVSMAAQSCSVSITRIDEKWYKMLDLPKSTGALDAQRLRELHLNLELLKGDHLPGDWRGTELLGVHLLSLPNFCHLRVFDFNASTVPDFAIGINDMDIERLACGCMPLIP